jgi:hypothetical protein
MRPAAGGPSMASPVHLYGCVGRAQGVSPLYFRSDILTMPRGRIRVRALFMTTEADLNENQGIQGMAAGTGKS